MSGDTGPMTPHQFIQLARRVFSHPKFDRGGVGALWIWGRIMDLVPTAAALMIPPVNAEHLQGILRNLDPPGTVPPPPADDPPAVVKDEGVCEYRRLTREELHATRGGYFVRTTSGEFMEIGIHGTRGGLYYHDYHGTSRPVPDHVYLRVVRESGVLRSIGLPDGLRDVVDEVEALKAECERLRVQLAEAEGRQTQWHEVSSAELAASASGDVVGERDALKAEVEAARQVLRETMMTSEDSPLAALIKRFSLYVVDLRKSLVTAENDNARLIRNLTPTAVTRIDDLRVWLDARGTPGAPTVEGWHVVEWRDPSGGCHICVVEVAGHEGRLCTWVGGRDDQCMKYIDCITRHAPLPRVSVAAVPPADVVAELDLVKRERDLLKDECKRRTEDVKVVIGQLRSATGLYGPVALSGAGAAAVRCIERLRKSLAAVEAKRALGQEEVLRIRSQFESFRKDGDAVRTQLTDLLANVMDVDEPMDLPQAVAAVISWTNGLRAENASLRVTQGTVSDVLDRGQTCAETLVDAARRVVAERDQLMGTMQAARERLSQAARIQSSLTFPEVVRRAVTYIDDLRNLIRRGIA